MGVLDRQNLDCDLFKGCCEYNGGFGVVFKKVRDEVRFSMKKSFIFQRLSNGLIIKITTNFYDHGGDFLLFSPTLLLFSWGHFFNLDLGLHF